MHSCTFALQMYCASSGLLAKLPNSRKSCMWKRCNPPPLSRTFHLYSRRFFAPAILCGAHLQLVKRWQHGEDTKLLAKLGMVSWGDRRCKEDAHGTVWRVALTLRSLTSLHCIEPAPKRNWGELSSIPLDWFAVNKKGGPSILFFFKSTELTTTFFLRHATGVYLYRYLTFYTLFCM